MAKDGYLIFDSDTHVGPSMDVLEQYLSAGERALLEPLASMRRVNKRTGQVTYLMGERKYERRMGETQPQPADGKAYMGAFTGAHKGRDPHPDVDRDASARIGDMDLEVLS